MQGRIGASTVTAVSWSSSAKSRSDETPTVTVPLMGRTQAKLAGLPLYSISSHSVDWVWEIESAIRWEATWVVSDGSTKTPPHAAAWGAGVTVRARAGSVKRSLVEKRIGHLGWKEDERATLPRAGAGANSRAGIRGVWGGLGPPPS